MLKLFSPTHPLAALGLLLATAGAVRAQTVVFTLQTTLFSTGGIGPLSVAVADVNGDGKPDALVANYNSNSLCALLGNGRGGFTVGSLSDIGRGAIPNSVVVADVNGDGQPDALTANSGSNTLGILLGDGRGGFTRQATLPATGGTEPFSVAVADVNSDGQPDALVANNGSSSLGVLLGDGRGGFALQAGSPSTGAGSNPTSVAVADVNGDGKRDILTANANTNTLGVLLGDGHGGFALQAGSPSTGGGKPISVVVADVNGDGQPDALVADVKSSTLGVLLGDGRGGFALQAGSPSTGAGSNPQGLAVADVNGDGNPDALTANSSSSTLGVLLGDGRGGFTLSSTPSTGAYSVPLSVAIADVNGDGKPDALLTDVNANTLDVLLNITVYAATTLSSLSPASGPVGTSVTLTGTNLSSATGVSFAGKTTTFSVVNATTLTATVPAGASSGNVTVTTPGGTTGGLAFAVTGALATAPGLAGAAVRVYPNPARAGFVVELPATAAGGPVQAELRNSLGQLMHEQCASVPAAGARLAVPTTGLAPGVYVLRLQAGGATLTRRVVVE